ncbi:MAG: hypothetical protein HY951_00615 [Bacteroidia bacterium]|nr:hypothetical protein [Bacteroidia bacterium]
MTYEVVKANYEVATGSYEVAKASCEVVKTNYEVKRMTCEVANTTCEIVTMTCEVGTSTYKFETGCNLTKTLIICNETSLLTSVSTFRFHTNSTLQPKKRKELSLFSTLSITTQII